MSEQKLDNLNAVKLLTNEAKVAIEANLENTDGKVNQVVELLTSKLSEVKLLLENEKLKAEMREIKDVIEKEATATEIRSLRQENEELKKELDDKLAATDMQIEGLTKRLEELEGKINSPA